MKTNVLAVNVCKRLSPGNITFSANDRKVVKCDLCDGDPQCAKFCPAEAIQFTEVSPTNLNRRKMIAERFKELFGRWKCNVWMGWLYT